MEIRYNSLNLPQQIDIVSPVAEARNEYIYSAAGQKLRLTQRYNPNFQTTPVIGSGVNESALTQTKVTDYVGSVVYENGVQKKILTDNGYYDPAANKFYSYTKDHQGNNRIVHSTGAVSSIVQQTDYYPFGMPFYTGITGQNVQAYKYNGKEFDTMHGLNLYDYSARQVDPAVGRFTTVDPLAEKYYNISPYAYCYNNPTRDILVDKYCN
ncbi:RHS repeat-associated core domain-containing protein [Viscerimonas tarda]